MLRPTATCVGDRGAGWQSTAPGSTSISLEETRLAKPEYTDEDKTNIGAGCDVVAVVGDKELDLVTVAPVQGSRAVCPCKIR